MSESSPEAPDGEPENHWDKEARALGERGWTFLPPASQVLDPDLSPPIGFGLSELDDALGGGYRVGLHLLAGFAHHGKTQLLLRLFYNNPDKLFVLFTPDEDTPSVMRKLLHLHLEITDHEMYNMSKSDFQAAWVEHYPNVAICDEFLGEAQIYEYLQQVEQYYGRPVDLVAYDYLGLFGNSRGGELGAQVVKAANTAKRLVKGTHLPWVVIHQANRQSVRTKETEPLGLEVLGYSGEQQATTVITMRRLVGRSEQEVAHYANFTTVEVFLPKNKQRPKLHASKPLTYAIDSSTGLLRPQKVSEKLFSPRSVLSQMNGSNTYGGYANDETDHGDGYGHRRSKEHYG